MRRAFLSWAGIVLTAAVAVVSTLLNTPEAESQLGIHINSAWVTFGALAAFILFVGWRVIGLERENACFRETRPNLTILLPEPVTIDILDQRAFEISISNAPQFAAAQEARIFLQAIEPIPPLWGKLPEQVNASPQNIGPTETAHFQILRMQRGATNGKPRAEVVCPLSNGFFQQFDLIHGSEKYLISFRATAQNLPRGLDFHCLMARKVLNRATIVWDVSWGMEQEPHP